MQASNELFMRVARKVAGKWTRTGIRSYHYEEMYQDAFEIAADKVSGYSEEDGDLEGYLYTCARNKVLDRVRRAICTVGTKSNGYLTHMGRTVTSIEVRDAHIGTDPIDYEHLVYVTQVRERMESLSIDDPRALDIALGTTTVAATTTDKQEAQKLYQSVRKLKHRMSTDLQLYKMAKDA